MTSSSIIVFIVPEVPKDPDSPHSKEQQLRIPEDRKYSPGESPKHKSGVSPASQRHFHPAAAPQSTVLSKEEGLEEMAEAAGVMAEGAGAELFPSLSRVKQETSSARIIILGKNTCFLQRTTPKALQSQNYWNKVCSCHNQRTEACKLLP